MSISTFGFVGQGSEGRTNHPTHPLLVPPSLGDAGGCRVKTLLGRLLRKLSFYYRSPKETKDFLRASKVLNSSTYLAAFSTLWFDPRAAQNSQKLSFANE